MLNSNIPPIEINQECEQTLPPNFVDFQLIGYKKIKPGVWEIHGKGRNDQDIKITMERETDDDVSIMLNPYLGEWITLEITYEPNTNND